MSIDESLKNEDLKKIDSNIKSLRRLEYFTDVWFSSGVGLAVSSIVTAYSTSYISGNTNFIEIDHYLPLGILIAMSGGILRCLSGAIKRENIVEYNKLKTNTPSLNFAKQNS